MGAFLQELVDEGYARIGSPVRGRSPQASTGAPPLVAMSGLVRGSMEIIQGISGISELGIPTLGPSLRCRLTYANGAQWYLAIPPTLTLARAHVRDGGSLLRVHRARGASAR